MSILRLNPAQNVKPDRKLLKPQVERHRRERINRSLDSLRALLQESQHQELSCRRMEKAEVLERTVLLLRNDRVMGTSEGVRRQQFQEGFSACLRRAAHVLRSDLEGRSLERDLVASFSHYLMRAQNQGTALCLMHQPLQIRSEFLPVHWNQQLLSDDHRKPTALQHRRALVDRAHSVLQRPRREGPSPSRAHDPPHSQPVWRPWS